MSTADEDTPATIRWAILGTGSIASDMVQVLKQIPHTTVMAIGSRTIESANRFADRFGDIPRRYGSYEEACNDPDVDVVYVATPSLRHPDDSLLALRSGKAVLCEKSMAPSYAEGKKVLEFAKQNSKTFVHAVWSRFFPAMQKVRELIDSGAIGEVRSARVSFCQNDGAGSCSALLETGIYCAQFLQWVLSSSESKEGSGVDPPVVRGACRIEHKESGRDEHVSALLEFSGGKVGSFECSLAHCSERSAAVYGTAGVIEIPFPFWCPTKVCLTKMEGMASQKWSETIEYNFPLPEGIKALGGEGFNFVNSQGLAYEAQEVNRCIREGLLESPSFTSAQCLDILRILSEIDDMSKANMQKK